MRIGIIKTQIAAATIICRNTKIQHDRFGVANVQIPIRLGRKARDNAVVLATGQIVFNDMANKVAWRCCFHYVSVVVRRKGSNKAQRLLQTTQDCFLAKQKER